MTVPILLIASWLGVNYLGVLANLARAKKKNEVIAAVITVAWLGSVCWAIAQLGHQ